MANVLVLAIYRRSACSVSSAKGHQHRAQRDFSEITKEKKE